jgi:hypothetical protein
MGIPLFPDAAALAPGAVLGLLGLWLGFRRWSGSWPMRWLVPLFGASAAAAFAVLHLIAHREAAALSHASGPVVRTIIAAIAFLGTFVGLSMFMGNLRERVAVWTAGRRIGLRERALGGLGGAVFGLLLLAPPYLLYEAVRSEDADPAWARESVLLPYIRSADAAARSALSSVLSSSRGRTRSER